MGARHGEALAGWVRGSGILLGAKAGRIGEVGAGKARARISRMGGEARTGVL